MIRRPGPMTSEAILLLAFAAERVVEIEADNVALRDSLGWPAGSGSVLWNGPTVPARLPGIGGGL